MDRIIILYIMAQPYLETFILIIHICDRRPFLAQQNKLFDPLPSVFTHLPYVYACPSVDMICKGRLRGKVFLFERYNIAVNVYKAIRSLTGKVRCPGKDVVLSLFVVHKKVTL